MINPAQTFSTQEATTAFGTKANIDVEDAMPTDLSQEVLKSENRKFFGTGARSEENRALGFRPGFMDVETGIVYLSCFSDGRPAPFHLLDGLPDEIVLNRNALGRVVAVKSSIVSGFVLERTFYTREEAAARASPLQLH